MAVTLMLTLTAAYAVLGAEGSFQPGSYEVSGAWVGVMVVFNLAAALIAGAVATRIDPQGWGPSALLGVVLGLGLLLAVLQLQSSPSAEALVRLGDVSNSDAMQRARQPLGLLFANPLLGALGISVATRWMRTRLRSTTFDG
jgi:hypothetical protein